MSEQKRDVVLQQEFAEMVVTTQKAAAELTRPWKTTNAVLAVTLAVVLLWRRN